MTLFHDAFVSFSTSSKYPDPFTSNLCAIRAKRVTVLQKDLWLARRLLGGSGALTYVRATRLVLYLCIQHGGILFFGPSYRPDRGLLIMSSTRRCVDNLTVVQQPSPAGSMIEIKPEYWQQTDGRYVYLFDWKRREWRETKLSKTRCPAEFECLSFALSTSTTPSARPRRRNLSSSARPRSVAAPANDNAHHRVAGPRRPP